MHCHAESTNFSSTIIPDVSGGLAPLWINCLALRNKFMTYNAVAVYIYILKKNYIALMFLTCLTFFGCGGGMALPNDRTTAYLLGC